jgi:hypothetical protein
MNSTKEEKLYRIGTILRIRETGDFYKVVATPPSTNPTMYTVKDWMGNDILKDRWWLDQNCRPFWMAAGLTFRCPALSREIITPARLEIGIDGSIQVFDATGKRFPEEQIRKHGWQAKHLWTGKRHGV